MKNLLDNVASMQKYNLRINSGFHRKKLNIVHKLVKPKRHETNQLSGLSKEIIKIAKLGGCLARASDPPPVNLVIWRGFSRLNNIHLGMLLAKGNVGNYKDRRTLTNHCLITSFKIHRIIGIYRTSDGLW